MLVEVVAEIVVVSEVVLFWVVVAGREAGGTQIDEATPGRDRGGD
jgi:hypothetical protein